MSSRKALAVVALVLAGASARGAERPPDAACSYEVVKPDTGPRAKAFLRWLRAHARVLGDSADLLDERRGIVLEVSIADVDNDGHPEYVLTTWQGSGHYLSMWVFRPLRRGWALVQPTPLDAELAQAREYRGPRMDSSHLLARLCGRTYVSLMGGQVPNYFPDSYVWEGGARRPACDRSWLEHQRAAFQALVADGFYDEAHLLLDGVQSRCVATGDPGLELRMQSDLALTAYRMKSYRDCLVHVAAAEGSAAFSTAGASLKEALAANAGLCRAAQEKGVAGDPAYDFSWLLAAPPRTQLVMDARFDALLSAVVPEVAFADGQPLRDAVKLGLWLAEKPTLVDGRYLLFAGCAPHDCGNRGFVWIDTVDRKAIVSASETFASTTIAAAHIPEAFWKQAPVPPGVELDYFGPDGRKSKIQRPDSAAR